MLHGFGDSLWIEVGILAVVKCVTSGITLEARNSTVDKKNFKFSVIMK